MSNPLIIENLKNTIIITFDRPKERSPLSISVLKELHELIDGYASDNKVKKVIFVGKDDVFASGADLREIASITSESAKEFAVYGQSLMNKIADSKQITIAAINGFCFGGALDLALACDKRIAAPNASFSHPGVNLGIVTGWGGTQRLPRLVGEAFALEMFLTAKRVDANEALQHNLIDKISKNFLDDAINDLFE
jgi:enoyl-CoA hydratase